MNLVQYLEQYDYLFQVNLPQIKHNFSVDYVWQCWLQGVENIPELPNVCLKSVQKYHANRVIKILDINTVQNYIDVPKIILKKYTQGKISPAHFSDYIRVALLAKYGGTWIDATVFLSGEIPQEIFKQEFFAFKFPPWCVGNTPPSIDGLFLDKVSVTKMCFSNWFLHTQPNNRIVQLLQMVLEEYWKREDAAFDYFMFHIFASYLVLKDEKCRQLFNNMLELSNAYPHLLQQCLEKEYDENIYNMIINTTNVHKLTHKIANDLVPNSFVQHIVNQDLCAIHYARSLER